MKIISMVIILLVIVSSVFPITFKTDTDQELKREFIDVVGFARYDWQIENIMKRINKTQGKYLNDALKKDKITEDTEWKVVISPHDDHSYTGYLYPAILKNLKAKIIILFGVAHKAKKLNLENKLIFDKYKSWHGPYGKVMVSPLRERLLKALSPKIAEVNNEMHKIEHSLEALIPFIQYYHRNIKIVPILVPYMSYEKINQIGKQFATALEKIVKEKKWEWGKDFAIAISSDSIHYGDQNWGGRNFAKFGVDKEGYKRAVELDMEIIKKSLIGSISRKKIELFTRYTVKKDDYKEYKWAWCGRYSIPAGLMAAHYLAKFLSINLKGDLVGYRTSITLPPIKVSDLKMGVTAPANIRHWVGYASIGYK